MPPIRIDMGSFLVSNYNTLKVITVLLCALWNHNQCLVYSCFWTWTWPELSNYDTSFKDLFGPMDCLLEYNGVTEGLQESIHKRLNELAITLCMLFIKWLAQAKIFRFCCKWCCIFHKCQTGNVLSMFQVMARQRIGGKPLFEATMATLNVTHGITQPQWFYSSV